MGTRKVDVIIYAKCDHLVSRVNIGPGNPHTWETEFDYCPICKEEIERKQDETQRKFDITFGSKVDEG